jgi:hypothetical protein
MPIEEYVVGQPVGFRGRFYDDVAMTSPADPATVVMWLRDPAGTDIEFDYALADVERESEGVFLVTHVVDQEGDWKWRWEATVPEVVIQGQIYVYPRNAGT